MRILSIQSQVVHGHVGNAAAVPALLASGCEVWAVPTTLLAHHPGYGRPPGRLTPADEILALVGGLERLGLLADCDALLSGWLGAPENVAAVIEVLGRLRAAKPKALFLCDPVIGDTDYGIYVAADLPELFRDRALPLADLATPNQFELEWLTGAPIGSLAAALRAADILRRRGTGTVICTSLLCPDIGAENIGTLAVAEAGAWLVTTPRLSPVPHGCGDLFAALLLPALLKGASLAEALEQAVAATWTVLHASIGRSELALVAAGASLTAPPRRFPSRRVA